MIGKHQAHESIMECPMTDIKYFEKLAASIMFGHNAKSPKSVHTRMKHSALANAAPSPE
jgi:uncharacterized GH25 family protein